MLTSLRIENFAIVQLLELDLNHGMTAFTGETGAGKSIMIDALLLALGGRSDTSVIRPGEKKLDISACFQIDADSEPSLWLKQHDLKSDDGQVILRRVIFSEGRSKSSINGQPFPLQKVKEFSQMLVHIHGQHQHQTLMHHNTHRQQLDRYADHESLLAEVQNLYKQCQQTKQELDGLQQQENHQDRIALLQFQIDELLSFDVQNDEMETLHKEHQLLHHAKDYLQCSQEIKTLINGDDAFNILSVLNQVLQRLNELPQDVKSLLNAKELLNSALIQCEESVDEIQQFANQIHLDPERLQQVENRMGCLHQLARKYQIDPNQINQYAIQLQVELEQLNRQDERITILQKQYEQQLSAYEKAALKLRASRKRAAKLLAKDISLHIQQLGMPKGYVEIEFTKLEKMQAHGLDKIEYKVCTNPGMVPDSLAKIASGGELSRISLAIEMITARRGATPILIFDEVDVGIGGATAALVGQLLRQLGQRLQVFCVTHQPQVASAAHHHYQVKKYSDNVCTFSKILSLTEEERINEIARMLGGLKMTEQTRSHARELLYQSA